MVYLFDSRTSGTRAYNRYADTVVRWKDGGWTPQVVPKDGDVVIKLTNLDIPEGGSVVRALGQAKNKLTMRTLFETHGVPAPKTWSRLQDAVMPFIARPPVHLQCRWMYIIRTQKDLRLLSGKAMKSWYFSEVLDVEDEYRALVFGGKVYAAVKKKVKGTLEDTIRFRRLNRPGSRNRRPPLEVLPDEWQQVCIKACEAVGLDFGAADLLISGGKPYVCEVNAVPMTMLCGSMEKFHTEFKRQLQLWGESPRS